MTFYTILNTNYENTVKRFFLWIHRKTRCWQIIPSH